MTHDPELSTLINYIFTHLPGLIQDAGVRNNLALAWELISPTNKSEINNKYVIQYLEELKRLLQDGTINDTRDLKGIRDQCLAGLNSKLADMQMLRLMATVNHHNHPGSRSGSTRRYGGTRRKGKVFDTSVSIERGHTESAPDKSFSLESDSWDVSLAEPSQLPQSKQEDVPSTETTPTATKLFHVDLAGEGAQGTSLRYGATCELVLNYSVPGEKTVAFLLGKQFAALREIEADINVTLFGRGVSITEGPSTQKVKLKKNGEIEAPVRFPLTITTKPTERPGISVIFDHKGCFLYECYIPITLVKVLPSLSKKTKPLVIDLDLETIAAFNNRSRTATLYINAVGDRLNILLHNHDAGTPYTNAPLHLTRTALAEHVGKVQAILAPLANHGLWAAAEHPLLPQTESPLLEQFCEKVVTAGSILFSELSRDDEPLKNLLSKIDALPDGSKISIFTDCAFLPWEILYPRRYHFDWPQEQKVEASYDPKSLWGYRFLFDTFLVNREKNNKGVDSSVATSPMVFTFGLNNTIENRFAQAAYKPIAAQRTAFETYNTPTISCDILETGTAIKTMLSKKNYPTRMIYLYCHGQSTGLFQPGQNEHLELDQDIFLEPAALNENIQFPNTPLIVLNSCSSGAFSPLSFSTFLSKFQDKGACGLVTTNFPIPGSFAAEFGKVLVSEYIAGRPIGAILYTLRRNLLDQWNPLGLFYSLQCYLEQTAFQPK